MRREPIAFSHGFRTVLAAALVRIAAIRRRGGTFATPWALLLVTLCGCRGTLPGYACTELWEEKDAVVVTVYLDEPLTANEYAVIARREMPRLAPSRHGVPVYEARFEFYRRGTVHPVRQRLARVTLVFPGARDDASGSEEPMTETVIY